MTERNRAGAMSWSDWTYSLNEAHVEAECEYSEARTYLAEHYGRGER
jgi:hypothetical protein